MRTWRGAFSAAGAAIVALLTCCSHAPARESRGARLAKAEPPAERARFTCDRRGAWSCDAEPASHDPESLCKHLTRCIRGRLTGSGRITYVEACNPLAEVTEVAAGSGISKVGFVMARTRNDFPDEPSDETLYAYYMLAEYEGHGWCLIDEVFSPMRVVAECEVNTRASVAATDDSDVFRLDLQSERIGHDYIEAEEPEAAGIADQECLHATYSLRDARFRKDKASSNELERCWIPVHPKPEQRR